MGLLVEVSGVGASTIRAVKVSDAVAVAGTDVAMALATVRLVWVVAVMAEVLIVGSVATNCPKSFSGPASSRFITPVSAHSHLMPVFKLSARLKPD